MAYTKIVPEANIELSGMWDMEFYTENPTTHYQNGILSDLEVLAIKRFKNGFGPIVTYSTKLGKSHLDFNARWIHDFDVKNRAEGDGFNFTASLKF